MQLLDGHDMPVILVLCCAGRASSSGGWGVNPNGIDTDRFTPDRNAGLRCRRSWGVPEDSLAIGLVGRLDRIKDHETFLRAAAILARSRSDVRFVCIGGGPDHYLRELRLLAGHLGLTNRVVWLGSYKDMSPPSHLEPVQH